MHEVPVNCLFKLAQEKVWLGHLTIAVDFGRKAKIKKNKNKKKTKKQKTKKHSPYKSDQNLGANLG